MTPRNVVFVLGVLCAGFEAVRLALENGSVASWHQLLMVGGAAAFAFALKWPGDSTKAEVRELEARLRRESILPPIGETAQDYIDRQLRDAPLDVIDAPVRRVESPEPPEPPNPYLARRDRRTGRQ